MPRGASSEATWVSETRTSDRGGDGDDADGLAEADPLGPTDGEALDDAAGEPEEADGEAEPPPRHPAATTPKPTRIAAARLRLMVERA
jgi:hypothetical protein